MARLPGGSVPMLLSVDTGGIATTANLYAHLTDVMRQRVADRMDGILGSEAG